MEEAVQCKKILQNGGVVTSTCARPRKAGHTLLILGGQTFMCDKIYQVGRRRRCRRRSGLSHLSLLSPVDVASLRPG